MFKHFKDEEVIGLQSELVHLLDWVRDICGFPIVITSGFRTPEQNSAAGGVEDSTHLEGLAVDIRAPVDPIMREKLVWALGMAGFNRCGSYPKHFHVDLSEKKPQNVFWQGNYK